MIQQGYVEVITEYNDILCGIKKRFSKDTVLNEKSVREIGRFAFNYYMRWTPQDIKTRLTRDILRNLKLDKLFEQAEKSFANGLADIKQSRAAVKAAARKKKDD